MTPTKSRATGAFQTTLCTNALVVPEPTFLQDNRCLSRHGTTEQVSCTSSFIDLDPILRPNSAWFYADIVPPSVPRLPGFMKPVRRDVSRAWRRPQPATQGTCHPTETTEPGPGLWLPAGTALHDLGSIRLRGSSQPTAARWLDIPPHVPSTRGCVEGANPGRWSSSSP